MDISAPCTNDTLFPIVTTMSDDDGAVDYSLQVSAMVADHEEQTEMAIEESLQETRQEKFSDNGGVGLPCDKWNSCSDSLLNDIILSFVRLYYLHATKLFLVSKQWNRIYRLRCLKEPTDLLIFLFPENWEINHLLWRCPLTLRQLEKRMKTVDSMTLTFDQRHVEKSPFDIVADSLASLLRCRLWTVLNCYMSPFDDQTQRIVPVKAYHSKLCSSKKSFIIPPPYCEIVLLTPNFRQFHHIKCYMSVWKPEYRKYEYEEIPVPQGKEPRTGAAAYSLMNSNGAFYHGRNRSGFHVFDQIDHFFLISIVSLRTLDGYAWTNKKKPHSELCS